MTDLRIQIDRATLTACARCGSPIGVHTLTGNWNHVRRAGRGFRFVKTTHYGQPS